MKSFMSKFSLCGGTECDKLRGESTEWHFHRFGR